MNSSIEVGNEVEIKIGGLRGTRAKVLSRQGDRAMIVLLKVDKSGYAAGNKISVKLKVLRRCEETTSTIVADQA